MKKADPLAPRIVQQLAVFLENKPGALAAVCDALAEAKINIFGLTVSDTTDHAVVRMVVSNTDKAINVFENHGALVVESDVLMIQNDNKPGSLSRIAHALSAKKINIDYGYLASMPSAKKGLLILRVTDAKRALAVLRKLDAE
ncbi:MAG: ACT domain-containing protein [Verrucomicrobia bacterium]|nr:ACT domain-containing protein [Verrucomicrobiota bacterium]